MATQEEIDALPDELTIALKEPIVLGQDTHATLTFREPSAGQLEEAAKKPTEFESTVWALGAMAGVAPAVIRMLPARKLKQASNFLASFTQDVGTTGEPA